MRFLRKETIVNIATIVAITAIIISAVCITIIVTQIF